MLLSVPAPTPCRSACPQAAIASTWGSPCCACRAAAPLTDAAGALLPAYNRAAYKQSAASPQLFKLLLLLLTFLLLLTVLAVICRCLHRRRHRR